MKVLLQFLFHALRHQRRGRKSKEKDSVTFPTISFHLTLEFCFHLVPVTPPIDLTVASNGPHQVMVKWKVGGPCSLFCCSLLLENFDSGVQPRSTSVKL